MTDAAAIAARNARMPTNRTPESASFPPSKCNSALYLQL